MKLLDRLGILYDTIKGIIITLIFLVLIVSILGSVVHNILKLSDIENKYTGEYKNIIEVDSKNMNIYTVGQGEKTIVILSGFGIQSPALEYKALAQELSKNYKVVIIEYFGYGFSSKTDEQRTNIKIVEEIRQGLINAGINGPYILMPHSLSNLYAMKYSQNYSEEVQAIISLDGLFPTNIEPNSKEDDYLYNMNWNAKFAWILEKTGYMRLISYIKPESYRLDKMQNELNYTSDEIKLYRKFIANKYLTKNMMNEIKELKNNIKDLENFKYNENLPVLNLLSNETLDEKKYTDNLKQEIEKTITNKNIQKNITVTSSHYLEIDNIEEIVDYTNNFLNQI